METPQDTLFAVHTSFPSKNILISNNDMCCFETKRQLILSFCPYTMFINLIRIITTIYLYLNN